MLEQAGDLHGVIKRFAFILWVLIIFWKFGCFWVMFFDYFLDFNTCYIDNCIGWIVVLEQVGSLHGIIRLFRLILGVFIKFRNLDEYGWGIFVDFFYLFFWVFNTCKHSWFHLKVLKLSFFFFFNNYVMGLQLLLDQWYWAVFVCYCIRNYN